MTNKLTSFIFLLVSCSMVSCGQQLKQKEQALKFLREIDNIYDTLDVKGNPFDDYEQKMMILAKTNKQLKLPDQQIDSLKYFFEQYEKAYDFGLSKLDNLHEFDTSFSFIHLNKLILLTYKQAWLNTVPTWLKVFKVGYDKINQKDSSVIKSTPLIMQEATKEADRLEEQITEQVEHFGNKYHFRYIPPKH